MKAMIGYGVFQKPDMVKWMESGIEENFPSDTAIHWYLEAPDHEMLMAMGDREFRAGGGHILEHGVHRYFIDVFMRSDCDVLIIPQDDNRFERPLIADLEKLWNI